jgi:hypothetical protein
MENTAATLASSVHTAIAPFTENESRFEQACC